MEEDSSDIQKQLIKLKLTVSTFMMGLWYIVLLWGRVTRDCVPQ